MSATQIQPVSGVRLRVASLKRTAFERSAANGPTLLGPQSGLELEWRVLNKSGATVEIPSPDAVLRLRVSAGGREIPVRTEWANEMTLRSTINGEVVPTKLPFGSATLPDGSSLWVRGSTKTVDGSVFAPAEYVLQLNVGELQQVSPAGARTVPRVDVGFPIQLHIAEFSSPEQRRQFHMIEGAFYGNVDRARALEHYAALASLPGAPWSDWLPLATMYNKLGRHREASTVFRTILPDLIRSLDMPLGENLRRTGYLRRAAMSLAVEGDTATATNLLRLEGRTPADRIPAEIERLRRSAAKADAK